MAIVERKKLLNVEVGSNMNRFWEGELHDDGTVVTRWGRVGNDPQSKTFPQVGEAFFRKKIREKENKGYTEAKTVEAGAKTIKSVGSSELHSLAKAQLIKSSNPILENLVQRFVQTNVHKITENTTITYNADTGLFSTPLGIVTMDGIAEARNTLADIAKLVRKRKYGSELNVLTGQYLRLVPQKVGRKIVVEDLFPDEDAIQRQNDLLDSLKSSNEALNNTKKTTTDDGKVIENVFKVDLDVLSDAKERDRVNKFFENSKKAMHGYDNIRVREIFAVTIHEMNNGFNRSLQPIHEVFHGTSQANCLSILKSGLKVSPPSTAAIAGKAFGNGIYGAINSTKSLGYTFGRWGQGGVGESGWLFICDFAMGRIQDAKIAHYLQKGYDSLWAKAGDRFYNDELIVYKNNQVNIKYLLECK
jgi:poly [ADP-ribose] polymerase